MEDRITFIGKYGKWTAIKKMELTPESKPLDVALFLARLSETLERKTEDFIKSTLNLQGLDAEIKKLVPKKVRTEEEFIIILKGLKSPEIAKLIDKEIDRLGLDEKDKLREFLAKFGAVYARRKALERAGLTLELEKIAKLTRKV